MIGRIYIIRNQENDKVYIGKTFNNIQTRFREHIRDSRKPHREHRRLYSAIKKYGEDCFYVELLEDNIDESILSEKEIEYIKKYDSYNNGYNNTLGGDGSRYITVTDEEVIESYNRLKCIKYVAKELKISTDTVSLILHNHNIELSDPKAKSVRIIELDMVFPTIKSCCEYLINEGISKVKDYNNVAVAIKRSIKKHTKYKNLTFEIGTALKDVSNL